jgi:hypothetical protein
MENADHLTHEAAAEYTRRLLAAVDEAERAGGERPATADAPPAGPDTSGR